VLPEGLKLHARDGLGLLLPGEEEGGEVVHGSRLPHGEGMGEEECLEKRGQNQV